jgi:HK97 family phage prohead protease
MTELHRSLRAAAIKSTGTGLGPRQIAVVATDESPDRVGDVVVASGAKLENYKRNSIVLAQHDPNQPIAKTTFIAVQGSRVVCTIEFPPQGTSQTSDEYCRLAKAGIISAVSIGFTPLTWEPLAGGGLKFTSWELLELSLVSVPANPNAVVIARSAQARRKAVRERQRHAARLIEDAAHALISSADSSQPRELLDGFALLERAREML